MNKSEIIEGAIRAYAYSNQLNIDGRNKFIKAAIRLGFTKDFIKNARIKRFNRRCVHFKSWQSIMQHRLNFLLILRECAYDPTGEIEAITDADYKCIHRASSNGKGWVCIAPDERANNLYTEDFNLVKFLKKKYKVS